jgi:hypothetical protein
MGFLLFSTDSRFKALYWCHWLYSSKATGFAVAKWVDIGGGKWRGMAKPAGVLFLFDYFTYADDGEDGAKY